MDNGRARLILQAFRPGGKDAGDPFFADALEQSRRDPELGRWFSEQTEFDEKIRAALRALRPPAGLGASVLFSARMVRAPGVRRRPWSAPAAALAAAVVFMLALAALKSWGPAPPMPLQSLTSEIVRMNERHQISLGSMNSDTEAMRGWLARHGGPHDFDIPKGLAARTGLGCQVYSIHGSRVSLLCYQIDSNRMVHYFVIERDRLLDPPPAGRPAFSQEGGVAFASWSDEKRTYVLAGLGSVRDLRPLL